MDSVAVFGASGKIGRHLLPLLHSRGLAVRALVHHTALDDPAVTTVTGSITDSDAVDQVVEGADLVVHLATMKEDPATFFEVSLRGTFNVLEACRRHRPKQVLLLSGDCVFGIWFYPQPVPISEQHPLTAYPGYYAFSKVMEETMATQYAVQYGVPVTILRSSWVFERDDLLRHFSLLANVDPAEPGHGFGEIDPATLELVRARQERVPILTSADGTPLFRHIVHVDDVRQAFDLMLARPEATGQAFNIAGPAPFNYRVAADYVAARLDLPTVTLRCPAYHSFAIDLSKARAVLGYTPANDFQTMADRALAARRGEE